MRTVQSLYIHIVIIIDNTWEKW